MAEGGRPGCRATPANKVDVELARLASESQASISDRHIGAAGYGAARSLVHTARGTLYRRMPVADISRVGICPQGA